MSKIHDVDREVGVRVLPHSNCPRSCLRRRNATLSNPSTMPAASPFSSAHRLYVKSLYKRYLKNELDWTVHRGLWRWKAIQIRAEFERNR